MRFLLPLLLLIIGWANKTEAQTVKSGTHQAFTTDNIRIVRFNIDPALIQVRSTRSSRVLVETTIGINGGPALLQYAIGTGRYNLEAITEGDILTLTPAPRKQDIIIKGEVIQESINYIIYLPEHLVQNTSSQTNE